MTDESPDLLVDVLLDLTDPHSRESIDLTDLTQRQRSCLCCDQHAVFACRMVKPLLASLTTARSVVAVNSFITCQAIDHG